MADANNEQRNEGADTSDIRSLSSDERVRRARELSAELRRQRAAERGETPPAERQAAVPSQAEPAQPQQPVEASATTPEPAQPQPGEPAAPPTPAQAEEPRTEPIAASTAAQEEPAAPPTFTPARPAARPPVTPFSWRMASGHAERLLSAIRAESAAARARTPVADTTRQKRGISRRMLLLGGFWTAFGLTMATALTSLDFLYPRKVVGFGGPIGVPAEQVPEPGGPPLQVVRGKFWLVNLQPGEGVSGELGEASDGGLLALWQKCPHLGCTVPWREDFVFGGNTGWFRCPCHGSTYTKGGVRVFGPAPRPMDTMLIEKQADGSVIVQTGDITQGGNDNPRRATPYP